MRRSGGARRGSAAAGGPSGVSAYEEVLAAMEADPSMSSVFKLSSDLNARITREAAAKAQRRLAAQAIPDGSAASLTQGGSEGLAWGADVGRMREVGARARVRKHSDSTTSTEESASEPALRTDSGFSRSPRLASPPALPWGRGMGLSQGMSMFRMSPPGSTLSELSTDEPEEAGSSEPRPLSQAEKLFKVLEEFLSNEEIYVVKLKTIAEVAFFLTSLPSPQCE